MQNKLFEELKKKLLPLFLRDKRIAAVYLFGSFAEGIIHKDSDIDLAVLVRDPRQFSLDDILELDVSLTGMLKTEKYDLVIANTVTAAMGFKIISPGKLIYVGDDDSRADFEERIMREYYDFFPCLNEFNREYFAAFKEAYA